MISWQYLKVDDYHTTASLRGGPKHRGERISCQQAELFGSAPAYSFLPGRRESMLGNYINSRLVTNGLVGWSGTWRKTSYKLMAMSSRETSMGRSLKIGKI